MYCVMMWQRVIGVVCVLYGGVAVCYRCVVCNVRLCGSVLYVSCVFCVVAWQHVL